MCCDTETRCLDEFGCCGYTVVFGIRVFKGRVGSGRTSKLTEWFFAKCDCRNSVPIGFG